MFGKILNYQIKDNQVIINFENQKGIVEVLTSEIINLHQEKTSIFKATGEVFSKDTKFEVKQEENKIVITTSSYTFEILDDFKLNVIQDGILISSEKDVIINENNDVNYDLLEMEGHSVDRRTKKHLVNINKVCQKDDVFYGLGEKTGFFNKREYEYEMWNTDNPAPHVDTFKTLYKSIPFYIVHNLKYTYGFFVDNTYIQYYDMAKTFSDVVSISFDKGAFDYYFIGGKSIKDVVSNYTLITGRTPLPQRWTLGYQQCRWSYNSRDELMEIARKYRELKIPCDTLFLDIDYMERFKVFTYDSKNFYNFKEMVELLNKDGFKLVTIIDPGVKVEEGYQIYEEAIKNKLVATLDNKTYINQVWPGDSVYPAFTSKKTRNWWGDNIKFLTDLGVSGIWNDMNEPASFKGPLPSEVEFNCDDNQIHYHDEVHNVYGHYMAEATYNGLVKHTNKRPYIITRACYAGSQKYSTVWTGDNHSIWSHVEMAIPMILNLGLSGFSFAGTDVGGFSGDCTKEMLCRWSQVGAFTPLFRNHSASGTRRQEPWTYDQETIDIYRKSVELRYSLIPYFYDLYYQGSKNGLPIIRPLVMNYPSDKNTFEINDQMMLGNSMLISPVVKQGERHKIVYLPEGEWYEYQTNKKYSSGYHLVSAPLDYVPVFVKANAIIPTQKVEQYISKCQEITFKVYGEDNIYVHYDDNGEDFKYREGEFNLYQVEVKDHQVKVSQLVNNYKPYQKIKIDYLGKIIEIEHFDQFYPL